MWRLRRSRPGERSRLRAIRALFVRHGAERTSEGRSLRLLRHWLSSAQRKQFAEKGYFEVVGGDTGRQYRIYAGAATNVCEIDENGHPKVGLCFLPLGELPIGDVMLAQKIALESCERGRLRWPEDSLRPVARSGEAGFWADPRKQSSASRNLTVCKNAVLVRYVGSQNDS